MSYDPGNRSDLKVLGAIFIGLFLLISWPFRKLYQWIKNRRKPSGV